MLNPVCADGLGGVVRKLCNRQEGNSPISLIYAQDDGELALNMWKQLFSKADTPDLFVVVKNTSSLPFADKIL